jgi:uncharacterized protein
VNNRYRILLAIAAVLAVAGAVYARFIEPRWIRIKTTQIAIGDREGGGLDVRIVHLTDLHLSPEVSIAYLRKVFREAAAQRPDLICLTGDYITDRLTMKTEYTDALKILSSAAPTFACPGNHDGGLWARKRGGYPYVDEVKAVFVDAGIAFLENETASLEIRDSKIIVAGLGDLWAGRCAPEEIQGVLDSTRADLKVILTHNPDSKTKVKGLKWDLLLAGHTHGGQFYFPFIGTPFAPVNDRKFVNGVFEYEKGKMYVSPGVGNLHGVRINCRPEISVLELKR